MFGAFAAMARRYDSPRKYWEWCEEAIDWNEDKTKFAKELALRGRTYDTSRHQVFDLPPVQAGARFYSDELPEGAIWSPAKSFVYANRVLAPYQPLELHQGHKRGTVVFDDETIIPVLFQHREGSCEPFQVWMSISPMEMLSQRQGVRLATGHVLIGGLGLGWLLRKVAEKKSVTKITLVEISQELLEWYGTDLCAGIQEETGTEIEVICGDVLAHMGEHGDDVRHLIDIWPSYPNYRQHLPREWQEKLWTIKHFWGWGVLEDPEDR